MTETSTHLNLPYILPAQAQKHVTHNEALRILDTVAQLSVQSADQTSPPADVQHGDRFAVGAGASGAWTGQEGSIAHYEAGQWQFIVPQSGWRAYDQTTGTDIIFDGAGWIAFGSNQFTSFGVNATADTYNRLAVSSDATLFDHVDAGHQMKINKAGASETASLLFQTSYSGRAEMGTAGTDDFAIKVSQDGSTWFTALTIDGATGGIVMPHTPQKEVLTAPRTYYVDAASGADTNDGLTTATALSTVQAVLDAMRSIDASGYELTVQFADGTYSINKSIGPDFAASNVGTFIFSGNSTNPDNVVLTGSCSIFHVSHAHIRIQDLRMESTHNSNAALFLDGFADCVLDNVVFGSAEIHIEILHSNLSCATQYAISGDAEYHIKMSKCASLDLDFSIITLTSQINFSSAFIHCQGCTYAEIRAVTFVGAATGRRYQVFHNSVVQTLNGGASYLPGNISGVASSGGRYS